MLEITVLALTGPIGFFTTLWAITEIHDRVSVFLFKDGRLAGLGADSLARWQSPRGREDLDHAAAVVGFLHSKPRLSHHMHPMWLSHHMHPMWSLSQIPPRPRGAGLRVHIVSHPSNARSTSRARALTPTVGGRRQYEFPRPPLVIDQWTERALLDDFGSRRGGAAARLQNDDE